MHEKTTSPTSLEQCRAAVAPFELPDHRRALWQILNTLGSYVVLWALVPWALAISWWLAIPIVLLGGGLLVRIFIIFHDCSHGSFLRSRRANRWLGSVCAWLAFTPPYQWGWEHARHHATSGDLDRRGAGDMWTLTVEDYRSASKWKRRAYRFARNPLVLFVMAPIFIFVVIQRFLPPQSSQRERRSIWATNVAVVAMVAAMMWVVGPLTYLVIQLGIMAVGGSAGVWLFYLQHQFEDVYWERHDQWSYTEAALRGSSYLRLPKILQWFSGNIGFHHVHHLSPKIPNYHLERCHRSDPIFEDVPTLGFRESLRSAFLALWDESEGKLVSFRRARA
ncbi:MAG: fatty acid desaturase [Planctomycetota bacterium]